MHTTLTLKEKKSKEPITNTLPNLETSHTENIKVKTNEITQEELRELGDDLQLPVTFDYPSLNQEILEIKNNLINSFLKEDFSYLPPIEKERMEEYQKILNESNVRIVLSESPEIDTCIVLESEIIVVSKGIIKHFCEQGLGQDGLAFVIGHEISHLLYDKSQILTDKEKEKQYGNHDKEFQCDKDALTLMDIAGYSSYVAKFDIPYLNKDSDEDDYDYGLMSSHPTDEKRNESWYFDISMGG